MAGKPEFAEFVATLSADDRELQKDLKAAETATLKSATKMQGSLDTLKVSAGNLGGVMGTLSQAGAAVGGQFGGIVGQGVAATQAMGQMAAAMGGPVGLIAALGALTVAVAFNREGIGEWARGILASIGIIEDMDAALAKVEARNATAQTRLDKQVASQARLNVELQQAVRLRTAQGTKNPEVIADTQRQISLEKRIAQELAAGGSQKSIELIRKIFETNKRTEDSKKRQLEFDQKRAAIAREDLERQRRINQLTTSRLTTARGLLVQIGAASPSDFIDDPVLKRLALLGEMVADRNAAAGAGTAQAARTGTFGLSRVQSPLSVVRAGEVIGRQTLTVQQETKQIAADHRDIARETKTILDDISRRPERGGTTGLTLSRGP